MKIEKIEMVAGSGYVHCRSEFYSAMLTFGSNDRVLFTDDKVNESFEEIDSGTWAFSYLLSMYKHRTKEFVFSERVKIEVNGKEIELSQLNEAACYMDRVYPMFSSNKTVQELVLQGLKKNHLIYTEEDIKHIFYLDSERYRRPLKAVGNEMFRAMAAIGVSHNKQVFCFPWLSSKRVSYYQAQLFSAIECLRQLDNKIVILPRGKSSE